MGHPRISNLIDIWLCQVTGTIRIHLVLIAHLKKFVTGVDSSQFPLNI